MTLTLQQSVLQDLGFVFSLAQNGAHHGHFDSRVNTDKNTFRAYLASAITRQTDLRGHPTQVFVARLAGTRVGAAIVTTAIGTPDTGVELALVAVKREFRGHGHGHAMLEALLHHYLPLGSVYARCLPASGTFRQMLLKRDFSEVGHSGEGVILRHPALAAVV